MKKFVLYGIGIIFLLSLIGSAFGSDDKPKAEVKAAVTATATPEEVTPTATPTATVTATPTVKPVPTPKPKPVSAKQRVKNALSHTDASGYVGKIHTLKVVKGGSVGAGGLDVYVKTPEGGFQGASVEDLDKAAGAVFAAAYGDANYRKPIGVIFRGGLVDTATGEDLPHVNTGIYHMTGSQAKRIDWNDTDTVKYTIDWSNYREFAHPALKQD